MKDQVWKKWKKSQSINVLENNIQHTQYLVRTHQANNLMIYRDKIQKYLQEIVILNYTLMKNMMLMQKGDSETILTYG